MAIKGVSVDLEDSLHARVSGAARIRGQKIPQAYTEALERWLEWVNGEDSVASPFGDISGQEEVFLAGMLAYYRQPRDGEHAEWLTIIERLAKRALSSPRQTK